MNCLKIDKSKIDGQGFYVGIEFDAAAEFDGSVEILEGLGTLRFKGSLRATGQIVAKAGSGIEAGWGIACKKAISVKLRIFAGLCLWRLPTDAEMMITCQKLVSGTVCFGNLIEGEKE